MVALWAFEVVASEFVVKPRLVDIGWQMGRADHAPYRSTATLDLSGRPILASNTINLWSGAKPVLSI